MASKDLSHTPSLRLCSTRQVGLIGSWTLAASLFANVAAALNQEMQPILANQATRAMQPTLTEARQRLASLALPWVPNGGQWNERAAFRAQSFAGSVWVTKDGALIHEFSGPRAAECAAEESPRTIPFRKGTKNCPRAPGWVLTERFVGGRVGEISGRDPEIGRVSYQVGAAERHAENLPSYGQLDLGEVYPGVRVELKANHSNVEKLYTVAPRQDPRVIRMAIEGAESLAIGESGSLIARTGSGEIAFTAPIAFQENDKGERVAVKVAYELVTNDIGSSSQGAPPVAEYAFSLGIYDKSRRLVIDPLLQSTYLGGNGGNEAVAIAIHPISGEVYVAGHTSSTDLPGVTGGAQEQKSAGLDSFVTRFNAALTNRLQSTYWGGSGSDRASALAIHPASGEIYIAGHTNSNDLPGVAGGAQVVKGLVNDAFVTRFNADLTSHLQSTYLGGGDDDRARALAIHPASGEVFVGGSTVSTDFPGVAGGAQPIKLSSFFNEGFVTRLNATLTNLNQSTYFGGGAGDFVNALAIHPSSGDVYLAGVTLSPDLPGVVGGAQPTRGPREDDAFVARFNAALTSLVQSTYSGGGGFDAANAIAINPISGEVFIAGYTNSTDLPDASGGAQPMFGSGSFDAFITRFNAGLTSRLQSTYLGGSSTEFANALAIHPSSGDVYLSGETRSLDLPAAAGGIQGKRSGVGTADAFVARFKPELTNLVQSTYLGGGGDDSANALAIDSASGDLYVTGLTSSVNLPGTFGGAQSSRGASTDAFVSRLTADLEGCALDMNKDGLLIATDEGLVLIRLARGQSVATAATGTRITGAQLASRNAALTVCNSSCSVGQRSSNPAVAAEEGLVLLRALLGFSSTTAVAGTAISESQWLARRAALIACGNALP